LSRQLFRRRRNGGLIGLSVGDGVDGAVIYSVGADDGGLMGLLVGDDVGRTVTFSVGAGVGELVGLSVGDGVGKEAMKQSTLIIIIIIILGVEECPVGY
jgi:hypothetical protein